MVIVAFQPGEKYAVNYTTLDQYDYGQILRIQGLKLPKTVEVHFSAQETGGTSITRVGVTKDGVTDVLIPDSVLENGDTTQNYSIFAFVYVTDATSGKTEYRAELKVKARPKPEVPGGGDNPDIFHEAVLEVRKSAEKAEEAQRQAEGWAHGREDLPERAEDNAMYYAGKTSEDAKKTAEDRKEVERLAESVSGIDEQVAKVEKLSKNAQEAATQAGTSAGQAELHKQVAETASSAAQTAAQETGADKVSVEKLSAQVQKNKESVDKTTQDFTLKAQQALADVNNAGQAQTERVQTAGTTAVENIENAQNTATQAVETAKAEAIKTVADKGKEVLEAIPNFDAKLDTKLDKNQGAEHTGKALVVGEDGNVVPGKPQTEGVGDAADAIVNTVSGMLLNIKDSAGRKNKGFEMSGKTEQVQITGAQLLDEQLLLNTDSPNYDKTTSASGIIWYTFPVEGTVTISVKNNKNAEYLKVTAKSDKSGGVWLSHNTSSSSKFATLNPEDGNVYLGVNNNNTQIKAMLKNTGGVMINKGETAKSYEPYTGGKPSPSPEYPQEIVNAGKQNEDTGKYEVDVKVTGKNLINEKEIHKTQDNYFVSYKLYGGKGIDLKAGITYTFSTNRRADAYIKKYDNLQEIIKVYGKQKLTYTPETNVKVCLIVNISKEIDNDIKMQLEEGTDATSYEPYKEQTLTLTSDRPLTKWDRLAEQDGQIGWLYKGKQHIVTGEESLRIPVGLPSYIYGNTTSSFLAISNNDFSDKKGYLNKLPYIPEVWISQSNKEGYCLNTTNQLHVRFANTRLNIEDTASISEREKAIKAHIKQQYDAGTPYMLWYESLQEEFVPLPQEQQNAIRALTTYYPTTVVTNSEDTEMQLTYVADTKNYTDRKIEEAVSAQVQNLANLLSLMPLSTQAAMIENDTNNILDMEVQE